MAKLKIFYSSSTDPLFNLAVEQCIFESMKPTHNVLFLWRNDHTVVIGRAQNPWKECNTQKMEQDGIILARRQSGGGAVFHDLGNTNFTFMAGKPDYNKEVSTNIILTALSQLGLNVKATGRNDLVIETDQGERKISGSAYREKLDRGFHHGTILLNANMSRLANYLNPDKKKLEAKGITSVKSRVINLCELKPDLTHLKLCQAIEDSFLSYYGARAEVQWISPKSLPDLPNFDKAYQIQKSWQWNFGRTPEFSHQLDERFVWGGVEIGLVVKRACIEQATIYTDSLDPSPFEYLACCLVDRPYTVPGVVSAINEVLIKYPTYQKELSELTIWLKQALR